MCLIVQMIKMGFDHLNISSLVVVQYDWEGEVPLSHGFKSDFIDWSYTGWDKGSNSTLLMDYMGKGGTASEDEFRSFFRDKVSGCIMLNGGGTVRIILTV